ncbi:MAG TPA: FAD-dependent oxidoreductase, partial [Ignisphaera sp.]|nr:FAD-dependent oxidoreductase [Ignisphaera sp.]
MVVERDVDLIVIGAGAAGMAAAAKARSLGIEKVLLVDDRILVGGILPQCIHTGFGLHYFKEDLTGPEFAERLYRKVLDSGAEVLLQSFALSIEYRDVYDKKVKIVNSEGIHSIHAKAVIVATGARERHVHEIGIVGDRPLAGVYTAGLVQALMDLYGVLPGREAVIIGSGDVGLIVARRLAMHGVKVKAVVEIMPWPGGLTRNIVQCLEDWGIPLLLEHAVIRILGKQRVEKVVVAKVDKDLKPVPGSEKELDCDTVIVAAGLRPDIDILKSLGVSLDPATGGPIVNEYLETSMPGIFVAGNALVINDLVDTAAEQGELAAEGAKVFIEGKPPVKKRIPIIKDANVRLVVPQIIEGLREEILIYGRVIKPVEKAVISFPELELNFHTLRLLPAEMFKLRIKMSKSTIEKLDKITIT